MGLLIIKVFSSFQLLLNQTIYGQLHILIINYTCMKE